MLVIGYMKNTESSEVLSDMDSKYVCVCARMHAYLSMRAHASLRQTG